MAHTVLAIGATALTAAGSVWYLPALADLRAGPDRPHSTRAAAAACLTWWGGTATAAVLLATPAPGRLAFAVAGAGAAAGGHLRLKAARYRRAEQREEAHRWAVLQPGRPRPADQAGPALRRLLVCLAAAVPTCVAALALAFADAGVARLAVTACGALLAASLFLLAATTRATTHATLTAHGSARRTPGGGRR